MKIKVTVQGRNKEEGLFFVKLANRAKFLSEERMDENEWMERV